jgi:hypothetical protein
MEATQKFRVVHNEEIRPRLVQLKSQLGSRDCIHCKSPQTIHTEISDMACS